MGTMGPVSEEPGLSLWDAMSVLCPAPAGRGVGGRQLGDPGSERRAHSPFNRKSASIWREKKKEYETTGILTPPAASARGRRPSPRCAPRDERGPGNGPKRQPSPPNCNFGAFARGLAS